MAPDAHRFLIQGPVLLGRSPELMTSVMVAIRAAQEASELTTDRADPDGDELALWVGPPAMPLAFALFFDVGRTRAWLDILYVAPAVRRTGLATKLIERVAASGRAFGATRILLGTRPANVAMQALAVKLRFEVAAINYSRPCAQP